MPFLRKMQIENAKRKKKLTIKITKFPNKACKARKQKKMVSICNFWVYSILKFLCYAYKTKARNVQTFLKTFN